MEKASEAKRESSTGTYSKRDLAEINVCIREHNADRPNDRINLIRTADTDRYIQRVIRYLGVVLS